MADEKQDTRTIDAKGNLHKNFADGRSEIYYGWIEGTSQNWIEITDATDTSVNRRRFIPSRREDIEQSLMYRGDDAEVATPEVEDGDKN